MKKNITGNETGLVIHNIIVKANTARVLCPRTLNPSGFGINTMIKKIMLAKARYIHLLFIFGNMINLNYK
jgi:hypothetical protein